MIGRRYYIFLMVFLGALSAFGPFITDFYLPTLPSLASIFSTTPSMVQLGLTSSMLGIAVGQLLFGPVSDRYGRRPLLVASLLLFFISTVAIIFSPTIEFFNVCRFLQGLGGSGGIVMSRSVATDCYTGRELAKTLSIVGAINGVAPVVAPLIGGVVANDIGWQGVFFILLAIGGVLLAMCGRFRESLPSDKRSKGNVLNVAGSFISLMRRPLFRMYIGVFGLAYG
ncbi:MAG: MFS transporter, partial [Muribaculaceae bacterium]|nr:MFS transporter [Muribaculaceae bacterium]